MAGCPARHPQHSRGRPSRNRGSPEPPPPAPCAAAGRGWGARTGSPRSRSPRCSTSLCTCATTPAGRPARRPPAAGWWRRTRACCGTSTAGCRSPATWSRASPGTSRVAPAENSLPAPTPAHTARSPPRARARWTQPAGRPSGWRVDHVLLGWFHLGSVGPAARPPPRCRVASGRDCRWASVHPPDLQLRGKESHRRSRWLVGWTRKCGRGPLIQPSGAPNRSSDPAVLSRTGFR